MGKLLKSTIFWVVAIALALVGLYALLGFYAAPKLIRSKAIAFVHEQYGRDLAVGEIRVNPFRLQLEIKDLALPDADKHPMLGFKRFFIGFELWSSISHRAFTFKDVILEAPAVRAVVRPNGKVNLADLAPKPKTPPPPKAAKESGLPPVWIESFRLSDGTADFIDQSRKVAFKEHFAPIAFSLKDFHTTPEGGTFGLTASDEAGERFGWKGHFALEPVISSQGEFTVADLRARGGVADFVGHPLPFDLTSGLVNLGGSYQAALKDKLELKADLPKIALSGLALRARGADADWVKVPEVTISDTKIAMPEQTVGISNVTVSGTKVQAWRAADGSINLMQLVAPVPGGAAARKAATGSGKAVPESSAAAPAHAAAKAPAWKVRVGSVDVKAAAIDVEDRKLTPAAKFAIAPLNVGVKDVSLDLAKPLPVHFDAKINGKGSLAGSGQLTPAPLAARIDLSLDNFNLQDVQPYASPPTGMTIMGGTLAVKGQLAMNPPKGKDPSLSFAGDITVSGFKSIDNELHKDFINFERVEVSKLRFAADPNSVSIDRILVRKPFNRVSFSPEGVLNVAAVLDPVGSAKALQERRAAEAEKVAGAGHKKSRAEKRAEKAAAEAAAKARAEAPPPEPKAASLPMRIREVRIEGGRMDFSDLRVKPNFAANITDLNGQITGISTDPQARAKVDLKGKVGEFSPVTIAGELLPFAYYRYTDIGMKFENISLPIFNPYSGKYAGYSIASGKLTTDLHYNIQNYKLDAKHHIRIDQLQWGQATAEKAEATLPVKFATSLLKDADGVIQLDIPVTGTINDPKFRIGPIVWQVIKNILAKAVTAPFRALGALFKHAEHAQFIDFAPGQAALDPTSAEHLAGVAKTLVPKSDIRINVPIGTVPELDQASLAEQRYTADLQSATEKTLGGKKEAQGKPARAFDTLAPDQKIEVLKAMLQQQTGSPPQIPPPPAPPAGTSRKDAKAAQQSAAIDYLQKETRSHATPGQTDLDQLGEARAEAIQKALLADTGLDPKRVFLVKGGKVTAADGKVRFELGLE